MTDTLICKKCKQPCDDTCAPCKKGYILHYRCMKPGDRLLVRLKRNKTTLVGLCGLAGLVLIPLPVFMPDLPAWWTLLGAVLAAPALLRMFWTTCS